jgi:hypothetical protein
MSNILRLALWKILNEKDAVLIPKNRGQKFSRGFLYSEFFGAGWPAMSPLHWLLLCLRVIVIWPGFVHGHQTWQEIIWIAPKEKIPIVAQMTGTIDIYFLFTFRHFGTHFAESCLSKFSWMMDLTRSREMPSYSAIDLTKIRPAVFQD